MALNHMTNILVQFSSLGHPDTQSQSWNFGGGAKQREEFSPDGKPWAMWSVIWYVLIDT